MKILVFSDSHNYDETLERALALHAHDTVLALHAGDGAHSFFPLAQKYPSVAFRAVRGNCDTAVSFFNDEILPEEQIITIASRRILLTHGHRHSVKSSTAPLQIYAKTKNADIAVFGHTHDPFEKYVPSDGGGMYLFNPGAARDGMYGIIELRDNGILMSHGTL